MYYSIISEGAKMKVIAMTAMMVYRLIEGIDGERVFHIISYKLGQKIKCYLLGII